MKRPIPLYFVAVWCFLAFGIQVSGLSRLIPTRITVGEASVELRSFLSTIGLLVVLWNALGLIQLKFINRWFSVVLLSWSTLALTWNFFALYDGTMHTWRVILIFLIWGTLNCVSIWFLARRRFREFAVQFVSEREREKYSQTMQKTAQKNLEKEIRGKRS